MLKIGRNWGKIANYPPQCLIKIGTTASNPDYLKINFPNQDEFDEE